MTTQNLDHLKDSLKDAIIAEIASDVLKIRDDLQLVSPLVKQLIDAFPEAFDRLQAGLVETLDQINEGIKEAGGERVEFVRGQLSVFIEQAIDKAFASNSDKVAEMMRVFEGHNNAAVQNLRSQFQEVSDGMALMRKEMNKSRFPTWLKVGIPVAFVISILCSALVTWQVASYKEALYMKAFVEYTKGKK